MSNKNQCLPPVSLKTMAPRARAAAHSPAMSAPAPPVLTFVQGLAMVMSSGRPQKEWSAFPSPI